MGHLRAKHHVHNAGIAHITSDCLPVRLSSGQVHIGQVKLKGAGSNAG